ncbi:plasmid partitioning protein RepB (plasmid) [Francisella halioticida]|uniref:ParB/RepB/Spo0J family partition protein n=1 Tax=Francisella halioticida TaxID=549298 RepID=UPI001AF1E1DE|nr:ParB/RepB/Spo0J family partition protein [Francisella halioticida]BCD92642.1 plasmid partitioning protein RepB [Francisella halioticida]
MAKKKLNFNSISDIKVNNDVDSNSLIKKSMESLGISSSIVKLDPNKIDNWIYRDRSEFELGNIDELAESIQIKGQAQPIILASTQKECFVPKDNESAKYVVIAGYRRWLACKKHNMQIDAIVKDISFEDAIAILDAENEKESVSQFSKGMFYSSLIKSGRITRDELRVRLALKAGSLSNLLAYGDIPQDIWNAIGNTSKVSPKTAGILRSYINKDNRYIDKIINIADKIRSGAGEKVIIRLLETENIEKPKKEVLTINNKNICEFKTREIVFNKSIPNEDIERIKEQFKELINRYYEG